eukprot:TRINITY_DN210_c0_g1_i1.p1 TRINITY_DN210_c0_g1~~TRINITY_DN210_c0_g1_i1.p1  ORF type:complete len:303 (+),score=95.70 TRINITY_DN210_c0_g1_i1:60-968(+)
MVFTKVVKNKAYYKRYQVKFRRRREGKTDYYARQRLILQDKTKYNSPKYRFVVRFTNKQVICQFAKATVACDEILASANSSELAHFGVTVGLTNYAAAYATGLLAARRALVKLGLDKLYVGEEQPTGEFFLVEEEDEDDPRPFYALLDVGLKRTTNGSKIFAALKGAVDGGIEIPHSASMKNFAGYDLEAGEFNPEVLAKYIYAGHVADYMRILQEDTEVLADGRTKYQTRFQKYVDAGVGPDDLEGLWKQCHANIRANPVVEKKEYEGEHYVELWRPKKKNLKQRKERIRQKIAALDRDLE